MTGKHTLGPWRATVDGYIQRDAPMPFGAAVIARTLHAEPSAQQANARLIAQSPAMEEALRDMLALHIAHHNNPLHAKAREILREIEGATPC